MCARRASFGLASAGRLGSKGQGRGPRIVLGADPLFLQLIPSRSLVKDSLPQRTPFGAGGIARVARLRIAAPLPPTDAFED
jgi:hypothetical protein